MHKSWRLHGISESYRIARRFDAWDGKNAPGAAQGGEAPAGPAGKKGSMPADAAALPVDRWLADPSMRPAIVEMVESTEGRPDPLAPRLRGYDAQQYLKRRLLEAFRRGDLVVSRISHLSEVPVGLEKSAPAQAEEKEPEAPPPAAKKTWVEIEVVDQDGEPVPNVRYEIVLADGKTKKGTLDGGGRAMVRDLEPGSYKVSFPDFDGSEWDTA